MGVAGKTAPVAGVATGIAGRRRKGTGGVWLMLLVVPVLRQIADSDLAGVCVARVFRCCVVIDLLEFSAANFWILLSTGVVDILTFGSCCQLLMLFVVPVLRQIADSDLSSVCVARVFRCCVVIDLLEFSAANFWILLSTGVVDVVGRTCSSSDCRLTFGSCCQLEEELCLVLLILSAAVGLSYGLSLAVLQMRVSKTPSVENSARNRGLLTAKRLSPHHAISKGQSVTCYVITQTLAPTRLPPLVPFSPSTIHNNCSSSVAATDHRSPHPHSRSSSSSEIEAAAAAHLSLLLS
ncbi:hypothetical protein QVD17_30673 [Tagetes erecta]|uniref:Uncharacterized protein n=1 Tax=Tagetes erecta TaxID=13708 RepID=A0AAD8K8C7_TARER|nr:hypothetical protein QVD17_30673 [Tagetes erecta]